MELAKKRNYGLDILRTFAIIFVVLIHSVERITPISIAMQSLPVSSQLLSFSLITFGRMGVPLFLLLTGYLLLSIEYKCEKDIIEFWKRKLLPLIFLWEVWIIIYTFFSFFFYNTNFSIYKLILNMCFVTDIDHMGHSWYMPTIIGIYIFIPLLSSLLHKCTLKIITIPSIIVFVYVFLFQGHHILDLNYGGSQYGIYLILGYILYKYPNALKVSKKILWFIFFILYLSCLAGQIFLYNFFDYPYNLWYDNPALLLICVIFFICIKDIVPKNKIIMRVCYETSLSSFGIYLIHYPLALWLKNILLIYFQKSFFLIITIFIIDFLSSFFIVQILKKTPLKFIVRF